MADTAFTGANANTVELRNLRDLDGAYIDDATVTLEDISDADGVTLAGPSYPVTMTNVSAGKYRVTLGSSLGLVAGTTYTAQIKAVNGSDTNTWNHDFTASERGST